MSYGLYKDAALTRPATDSEPKWFLVPEKGGTKTATLYLGDPQSPLSATVPLVITPKGPDVTGASPSVYVALRPHVGSYGISNTALILAPQNLATPIAIDVQMTCAPGGFSRFQGWRLEVAGVPGQLPIGYCATFRTDQGLAQSVRVIDPTRLTGPLPGFVWGRSRWRDESELNQQALVSTQWDIDPVSVGVEKFICGIGAADDLKLLAVEKDSKGALRPRVQRGDYFTGFHRHYLPADPAGKGAGYAVEAVSGTRFTLRSAPRPQTPVFIGRWRMDGTGLYETDVSYRYTGRPYSALDPFDPDDDGPQYTLDHRSGAVRLNRLPSTLPTGGTVFLGILPEGAPARFYVPYYPVLSISRVWAENPALTAPSYRFDATTGVLELDPPPGGGSWSGRPLYASCITGLIAVYELPPDGSNVDLQDTRLVTSVDLNPAASGVLSGVLHLTRRRWQPASLQLYADKPRISVPAGVASKPNVVAFGPVFCAQDYALLLVRAYGSSSGEMVPGVKLKVVPEDSFEGQINYQDPTAGTVWVTTGADGAASMIYTPPLTYGWYLALGTSVSGNTLTLPAPVPASEVYTELDGWRVLAYQVLNDDPYLGKVGAIREHGEVPWTTAGTPGASDYQTNGKRVLLKTASKTPLRPTAALNPQGGTLTTPGSNDQVAALVFSSLPAGDNVGAYFVAIAGRATLHMATADGKLVSNPIVLQLAPPEEITDQDPDNNLQPPTIAGYLILDDPTGRLDVNRLAGGPIPGFTFE